MMSAVCRSVIGKSSGSPVSSLSFLPAISGATSTAPTISIDCFFVKTGVIIRPKGPIPTCMTRIFCVIASGSFLICSILNPVWRSEM